MPKNPSQPCTLHLRFLAWLSGFRGFGVESGLFGGFREGRLQCEGLAEAEADGVWGEDGLLVVGVEGEELGSGAVDERCSDHDG